jgi:hypothetical protein
MYRDYTDYTYAGYRLKISRLFHICGYWHGLRLY